jgi:hypothetical protein
VASEVNGTWHAAKELPGLAALATGVDAVARSVSCASAGNCGVGGFYADSSGGSHAFVASKVHGTWHNAVEVPGLATLSKRGYAGVNSVSCGSAGNCGAGGYYMDGAGRIQAFVISEVHGTWHTAIEVPGLAALNQYGHALVVSMSCASAASCDAGGSYMDSLGRTQAFVVSAVHGTWHTAIEVPGTAALNKGGTAQVNSVSCGAAGNCSAGGFYSDISYDLHAFVVNES